MNALNHNLKTYDWARKQRDQIVRRANKWLKYDDERLRSLVIPPEIPRAIVAHEKGAPINGDALNKIGRNAWKISFDKPWKVTHPADGKVYPSNNFEAFRKSGCKDRSLLTGPYPDDGWGCYVKGEDRPFWFVAFYAHWSVTRLLLPALDDLSRAYLITGDSCYAHACALLLWQLAEYYPRYVYEKQSRYGREVNPGYKGRLLYHTWESHYTGHSVPPAYHAVRPAIRKDRALMALTGQTARQIHAHIEDRLLRTMAGDIMDGSGRIQGNYGMHQVTLLRIAAVFKNSRKKPTSRDMVAWVLNNPDAQNYTQLGLEDAINNLLHRDGYPFESPQYNTLWIKTLNEIVEALGPQGRKIIALPRFRKLHTWVLRMACAGRFVPSYGDSNNLFHTLLDRTNLRTGEILESAYRHYKAPIFARALKQINARPKRDLFLEPLDGKALAGAAKRYPGRLGVTSELLPGVGFASLQTGSEANPTALALFYGYYWGHAHNDRLQLDIYSWGHALTPDFGYPETADAYDPRRYGFLSHTVTHNTVMVNARRQATARGRLHLYDPGPFAQLVETSAEAAYAQAVSLYRRTLLLVDVAPDKAYIVDIFRVRGGAQHDWIVHGPQAELKSDLPFSKPRKKGTLAGQNVPYGDFYDDSRYDNNNTAHVSYSRYEGSAFQWFFNVQQAKLNGVGAASWRLNRPPDLYPKIDRKGVVLRAHLIGRDETVFACDGVPQRRETWPETVKFLFRRRTGENLESVYITVFEPYRKTPFIHSVRALPTQAGSDLPVALEIACGKVKHILFNRLEKVKNKSSVLKLGNGITLDARAAVLEQTANGDFRQIYLLNNNKTEGLGIAPAPAVRTRVKRVDYEKGLVTLTRPIPSSPAGGIAIVESAKHANAIPVAEVVNTTTFAVGDDELSAGTVHITSAAGNRIEFNPKYVYFIEPGMTVVNEAGRVVGRIKSIKSGSAGLDTNALTLRNFPDRNRDGRRTCRVMVVGPGDTLTLHTSLRHG